VRPEKAERERERERERRELLENSPSIGLSRITERDDDWH